MKIKLAILILALLLDQHMSMVVKFNEESKDDCETKKRYLIFDAGSTNTRLYYYRLGMDENNYDWQVEYSTKVGEFTALSSFTPATFTTLGAAIGKILNDAKEVINPLCIPSTPIYLRATAGLRSLDRDLAEKILQKCRNKFSKSVFKNVGEDSAKMFTGQEEGIWLWVFMNYVLGNFLACGPGNKVQGFDLGGGSTQLATLKSKINYKEEMVEDVVSINLGCPYQVYSVSYEPAGAQANRKNFFVNNKMTSECMADGVTDDFKFGDFEAQFTGTGHGGKGTYEKCLEEAKKYANAVKIAEVWDKENIPDKLYLIASFYYVTRVAMGIDKGCKSFETEGCSENEYVITVEELNQLARRHCKKLVDDPEIIANMMFSKYLCIDLVWMEAVLAYGYGLRNEAVTLHMLSKVNGHSAIWATGFAYGLAKMTDSA